MKLNISGATIIFHTMNKHLANIYLQDLVMNNKILRIKLIGCFIFLVLVVLIIYLINMCYNQNRRFKTECF